MTEASLTELYARHQGKVSDKWALYLREYDRLFAPWRAQPISLVEIGVQNGGSLELWARYFPGARCILGVDIDPGCADLRFDDPRIEVLVGDAGEAETAARVGARAGRVDILIEDGSHRSGDIIRAFAHYFGMLAETGLFVVEDLHCSYWESFEGGLYDPYSSMAFFKCLADVLNRDHWGMALSVAEVLAPFGVRYGFDPASIPVDRIHSISFLDSLCVIRKAPADENALGERWVAGCREAVQPGSLAVKGSRSQPLDQTNNPWLQAEPPLSRPPQAAELFALYARALTEVTALARREHARHLQDRRALDEQLAELAQVREALGAECETLQAECETLRAECDAHTAVREQLDQVERRLLEAQEGHRAAMAQAVDEQRELLDRLEALQGAHDQLNAHAEGLAGALEAMRRSWSWRLTLPLRLVPRALGLPAHLFGYAAQVLALGGGPRATLALAWRVLRQEGLQGVLWRLDNVRKLRALPPDAVGAAAAPSNHYPEWIRRYDRLDAAARERIRERIERFAHRPLISVVMPVYNTPLAYLDEAIRSVREQLYPHWELCIADDASTDEGVRDLIRRHLSEEPRIKAVFREENGHISAASNSALALATGEFVALLDHDDRLPEHALFWVAQAIEAYPDAAILYSDEDKIDGAGRRFDPYFKCELNPELLLAHNMISHLGVYRRALLESIGGFRIGFEGSQDYDLALRALERIAPSQVVHIPRVLYHWRAIAGSTALAADEKDYAAERARAAVREHLERTGRAGEVEPAPEAPAYNRVRWHLSEPLPLVTILIPTRDRVDLLEGCIGSILFRTTYPNYEVLIIDNGSEEEATQRFFAHLPTDRVRVLRDARPFNFSALNNVGAAAARGEMLCLMNNDIEVMSPAWLEEMASFAQQPDVGCVGARLWYPDGRLQHGGVFLGVGGVANHAHLFARRGEKGYFGRAVLHQSLSAVTAACLLVRREVFEAVGGLDEALAVAFNDVDFCLRVREAGYRNVWTPYAELRHHESATRGAETTPEKQARFVSEVLLMESRWGEALRTDPAYSPNLTLDHPDFSLAWPPRLDALWSLSE